MANQGEKPCSIVFNRANKIYKPGDLLTGNILVKFTQPMKIRGIRIEILGESVVAWRITMNDPNDGGTSSVTTSSREEYLSEKCYVIGSDMGRPFELPAAPLSYAFSMQLPMDLPSSFWHEWGSVYYEVKAIFERPWGNDYEVEAAFTIVSNYDLNQKPQASLPIQLEIHKTFCFFCICPWGKMHTAISVPSTGFVPGQTIPVTVHCQNESTVSVSKIKIFLQRKLKFYTMIPKPQAREKEDVIAEKQYDNPYTTTFDNNVTVRLQVPQLPPSGLEYCSTINLNYSLKVVISFSGLHCSIERTFPVLIGTVPLESSPKWCSSDAEMTLPSPSAPLLQKQPSAKTPSQVMPQTSSFPQPDSPYPGQWDSNHAPPPSYDATMYGDQSTRDTDDSRYHMTAGSFRAPEHRLENYGSMNAGYNAPAYEKL